MAVGDAMRTARGVRALRAELRLERLDEDLEQIERQRVRIAPDGFAHRLADDRADDDGTAPLRVGGGVDLAHRFVDLFRRIDEGNRHALKLEILELREKAVAEHLRGDAGAIGNKKHGALPGHVPHHHVDHTGSTPTGSGGNSPKSSQLSPGAWKSEPHDPLRPNARAYVAYSLNCAGVWDGETISIASPPASRN